MGLLTFIIVLIILGLLFFYTTLSWGLVLHKFWFWFLLPVFPDIPIITFIQALGLMFFIGLFKNHNAMAIKKKHL